MAAPALPKQVKSALNEKLDELLSALQVSGDWPDFSDYERMRDFSQALLAHEPWRSHLRFYELYELTAGVMKRRGVKNEPGPSKKLVDLLGSDEFEAFKLDLRDTLLSLPRRYVLWVELPTMPQWGVGSIKLSNSLELVERKEEEVGLGLMGALASAAGRHLSSKVYLCVSASGYGAGRMDTTAAADGISQVKQFFQMFRRTKAFKTEYSYQMLEPRVACWLVDVEHPDVQMNIILPERLVSFLASVTLDEDKLVYYDHKAPGAKSLVGVQRKPETKEERTEALLDTMLWVKRIMACPPSEDVDRILTAFEWSFDSAENNNETLAFIQACVGLEALLGDSDREEPLAARLADRCAYLLGKTHSDREGIRKRFKAMYDVRSKLIHGRTPRLSFSDAEQLFYAKTILGDVLTEEATRLLHSLDRKS